jgi:ubiquinone/menaquinone biosynthesis C-methylase UbiE
LIKDPYLASGFRDVDANSEAGKFIRCLQFLDGLASFQDYKAQVLDRLRLGEGMAALDLGCGLGFDAARMGALVGSTGRVVGLDRSEALLRVAADLAPGISFELGVGEELRFASAEFDAARVDRTLQHVEDPYRVITEMHRVLKPGGRIACAEPDWGTFVVTSSMRDLTRRITEAWSDSFRNGWIGRWLRPFLTRAGFVDVELTGHLLIADGFAAIDAVFDVAMTAQRVARELGDAAAGVRWLDELSAQDAPLACVTLFLATGRKP